MKHFPVFILFATLILGSCTPPKEITGLTLTTTPALIPTVTATKTPSPVPTQTITPDAPIVETPTLKPETPTPTTFSSEQLSQMTDEEKVDVLNAAPETIDGLTRDTFSTIKNTLIIYRNDVGSAALVFDLSTNETSPLLEAGIVEFDLTDGTKWEMRAFVPDIPDGADAETIEKEEIKALEEMVNFMVQDGVAWGDLGPHTLDNISQEVLDFIYKIGNIPDWKPIRAIPIPQNSGVPGNDDFLIELKDLSYQGVNCTLVVYIPDEGGRSVVIVKIPVERLTSMFLQNKVTFPSKP